MKPELIVIDTLEGILKLREYLNKFDYIAYDCETTGLTKRDQIIGVSVCAEISKAYYVILHKWENGHLLALPTNGPDVRDLINDLKNKSLIMHNGIFDCMMAEAYFKTRLIASLHTDTMVLAHLLDENRRVGLKELAKQYFGEDSTLEQTEMKASVLANGGVLTKALWEGYKADPYLMGKYGAKDAWLTYKLFMELIPELDAQGLTKFFYEDESMPLLRGPTYELNTTGLQVNVSVLRILKKSLEAECAEAKAYIHKEIESHVKDKYPGTDAKSRFNIGSSKQLAWLLFGKLGLEFGNLTKGGKGIAKELMGKLPYTFAARRDFIIRCTNEAGSIYQQAATVNGKTVRAKKIKQPWDYIAVDKETLKKLAPKLLWVAKLLEYNRKMKLLNTYVKGIESRIQYGVIHPSYLQSGTTTGRYASRNINFQNLPRDDKRIKNCFVARPGKIFVSADYSQLEPRVFASYSQDEKLMNAFDGTSDFYSVVGMEVYDKFDCVPQKDTGPDAFGIKYKKLRDCSKGFSLAFAYGATPNKVALITGRSIEDTADDMEKYFERFPGVQKMMLDAHKLVMEKGYVTNLYGRVRRIPDAQKIKRVYGNTKHSDLPYAARQLLNMACNFRIQSTGASIVNRAMIKIYDDCKYADINCQIVGQVHDQIILECDVAEAATVSLLLQSAMENTTLLPGVNLEAKPIIGATLGA